MLLLEPDPIRFFTQLSDKVEGFWRFFQRVWILRSILAQALPLNLILRFCCNFLVSDDVLLRGDTKLLTTVAIAVKPEASTFGHGEHKCHIQAGMAATSDILSKEERALQFMLRKARLITDL